MEITILGSAGSEAPGQNSPAFLVDDCLLLDGGTVGLALERLAPCSITHVLLTHAHLDHFKGIPFLLDNLIAINPACNLQLLSGKDVIADIRKHIFNNRIWPDFTTIPNPQNPVLSYRTISTRSPEVIGDYTIVTSRVNHTVPAYGYLVEHASGSCLLYTGDTGPTEAIWKKMRGHDVKALIVEVSFPNELISHALTTGHLCPSLLEAELHKMPSIPDKIYISHLKAPFRAQIEAELARIPHVSLELLEEGKSFSVP
ncbi:MAG: 3',5'-cyclic-nucleotide phosphodiesterase [Syntrophobacteraceae bacterium]|nr:3',5'-cyclic-nucleotide phosphodiesterase [Syntrophobacteraceae bacterium]